jgi:pyruvate/2-oxoglutarate dehydrogenase complex dihydrolipoamide dehydrogenase (E3) component
MLPQDKYNDKLVSQLGFAGRINPQPADKYNMVVIGAGPAGLVTAAGAAGLGAKVALVESHLMGGDCLNYGCVPSKSLIASANAAYKTKNAGQFGINIKGEVEIDFSVVMERLRKIRASIAHHDSVERFTSLGIDVFGGKASFIDNKSINVAGKILNFKKAVVAAGTSPFIPQIKGIEEIDYLTNETVFSLTELPKRLAVIGGGPIGCELAQCFRRFGSEVTLIHNNPHILDREDEDAAEIVQQKFIDEGISLHLAAETKAIVKESDGIKIDLQCGNDLDTVIVDKVLIAAGRKPNVSDMMLENAGIEYDERRGVKVNDNLRTSNKMVFAAGDIWSPYKFTHTADAMARIVIQNALFFGRKKVSNLIIPWCTYTDPEIAHVGKYSKQLESEGTQYKSISIPLSEVDRAVADSQIDGFTKIHVAEKSDKILGATIVAETAGDMISEISLAMQSGTGLGTIASTIHPYPTQAEVIKKTADAYNRDRLTPFVAKMLKFVIKYL